MYTEETANKIVNVIEKELQKFEEDCDKLFLYSSDKEHFKYYLSRTKEEILLNLPPLK